MGAATGISVKALHLHQADALMGGDLAPHIHLGGLLRGIVPAEDGQIGLYDFFHPAQQGQKLLILHGPLKLDVAPRVLHAGDDGEILEQLPGGGRDQMLGGVVLHMGQTGARIDAAKHLISHRGLRENVADFSLFFVHIQHRDTPDGTFIALLSASPGEEDSLIQNQAEFFSLRAALLHMG